jgi:inner membrane protein involved in colicin E2 resistance
MLVSLFLLLLSLNAQLGAMPSWAFAALALAAMVALAILARVRHSEE